MKSLPTIFFLFAAFGPAVCNSQMSGSSNRNPFTGSFWGLAGTTAARSEICKKLIADRTTYYGGFCNQLPANDRECQAACEERFATSAERTRAKRLEALRSQVSTEVQQNYRASWWDLDRACYEGPTSNPKARYRFARDASVFTEAACVAIAQQELAALRAADEASRQGRAERDSAQLAKEHGRKLEEEAQLQRTRSELQSGKRKPKDFGEAIVAFDAAEGNDLASAPKIRPDGKSYALLGVIDSAKDEPEFLARSCLEIDTAKCQAPRYFVVLIPAPMREAYFRRAKVDGSFGVVASYTANREYTTVSGQKRLMPVFEATFLDLH